MTLNRRDFLKLAGTATLASSLASFSSWGTWEVHAATDVITDEEHILNRLTWGTTSQDRAQLQQMGIAAYLDWQLQPENIPDPLVEQFVSTRRLLTMDINELSQRANEQYGNVLQTALWARLYRAIYSQRQLHERMVEFWTDHFNIPISDYLSDKIVDDRNVIRQHALGKFRDLLFGSSQSPAMLLYLDNVSSNAEHPNENYARELMELHTLGVDGGYTETDVVEVARIFTGWTLRDGGFRDRMFFNAGMHDFNAKTALGYEFPPNQGIEEGLRLLDILANHPSTARFISYKLCRRFVSDMPSQSLIESTTQVFLNTQGDIRQVMRHILTSSEFMASRGQKFRRPLEAVVAMVRTLTPDIVIENPQTLISLLEQMGHLPYFWHAPNGYPDVTEAWLNTNSLLYRWNTAMMLGLAGDGYVEGMALNLNAIAPMASTVGAWIEATVQRLLGTSPDGAFFAELVAFVSRTADANEALSQRLWQDKAAGLVGLILASPVFQWA